MRIRHYIKNLLIFLPIIFAGRLFDVNSLIKVMFGFVAFSLLASVVYTINDICDLEYDRNHALKKTRPLASGEISIENGTILAGALGLVAVGLNAGWNNSFLSWLFLLMYISINIAYSFGLKNIPLIDISIVALGFILRVSYGGAIIDVPISSLLYLTVIAISFYLVLGKRRNEIKKVGHSARFVLKYYTAQFLGKMMNIFFGLSIVFYSFWCIVPSDNTNKSGLLILTVPLILLICRRYSMDIEGDSYGDPADVLLGDKVLIHLVLVYGLFLIMLIYNVKLFNMQGL